MKARNSMWWTVGLLAAACLAWCPSGTLQAQQAPAQPKPEAKAEAVKERAKPRGRLPAYYARVVTPQQRESIYKIQETYAEKLEALRAQLAELEAKMGEEIKAVLSPEQLKKVDEFAAEAKARTKKPATAGSSETPATPAAKPGTTAVKK